jgi:hypothetical protein
MPVLQIKNFPKELHDRLKEQAKQHRRSVPREALSILKHALQNKQEIPPPPPPYHGEFPLTQDFLEHAKSEGRE